MDTELDKLNNEVLRKIGRNLILFQYFEGMLKFLLANGRISGYAKDLAKIQEQRATNIRKQTMGQLTGQFLKTIVSESKEFSTGSEELKEVWISLEIKLQSTDGFFEIQKTLVSAVAERNELVHHFLPKWDMRSFESGRSAEQYLDQQRKKILPDLEYLQDLINAVQDSKKALADYFSSSEFKRYLEISWLRQSRLTILLRDIALQKARPDGWTELTIAGQLIRQYAPEEVSLLKERYGHKTLKGLILATDIFDVSEESTDKGGVRVLYRIKPDTDVEDRVG